MNGGLRCFGFLDEADDPGKGRISAGPFGADVQRPGLHHRAGKDSGVLLLVLRGRFTGDRRLIHSGGPRDDNTVDRDLLAGTNQDHVTGSDRVDVDDTFAGRVAQAGGSRDGADQAFDRSSGPFGVQVGDELREQDDRHQHCAGDGFAADQREDRRERDEDLGANLVLMDEIGQAGLGERVQPDRDRRPQHSNRHPTLRVREHQPGNDDDPCDLQPTTAIHHRNETDLRPTRLSLSRPGCNGRGQRLLGGHPAALVDSVGTAACAVPVAWSAWNNASVVSRSR